MELLEKKISTTNQALKTLYDIIKIASLKKGQEDWEIYRDSLIKRFEYSFDCFWKAAREHLKVHHKLTNLLTPHATFVSLFDAGLLSSDQFDDFIRMYEDRNNTTHGYHEDVAQRIVDNIPGYYQNMTAVINLLRT